MKIDHPGITLADEARNGVEEDVRSGFLDWLFEFNVTGDDGELYALGGSHAALHLYPDVIGHGHKAVQFTHERPVGVKFHL